MVKTTENRIKDLKAMHQIIMACNNEEIYMAWVSYGWIPDEPTEEDFVSVASDNEQWKETCDRFGKYMKWAVKDGGYYFDNNGYYIV